jgi:hypothetical protein
MRKRCLPCTVVDNDRSKTRHCGGGKRKKRRERGMEKERVRLKMDVMDERKERKR